MKAKKKHDELLAETPAAQHTGVSGDGPDAQIQQRAYELWRQRGGGDGHAWEDWLQAETEIKATLGSTMQEPPARQLAANI